jgi:Flp pilus assembly protein TadD
VKLNLGLLYLEKKDFGGALRIFQEIARLNPDFLGIHNILGSVYLGSGRIDQAVMEFKRALEQQPGQPDVHYNLGQAYFKQGLVEAAEAEYKKALGANPAHFPARLSLAYLYLLTRRLDAAVNECAVALKASPGLGEASCMLACALLLRSEPSLLAVGAAGDGEWDLDLLDIEASRRADGSIQEAIVLCQKAIAVNPRIPEAHNTLGAALAYQGKFAEAEAEFMRAREIKSDYQEAHYNLAFLYYIKGEMGKAAQHISRVLEINPGSDLGRQVLTRIFLEQSAYAVFARLNKE